MERLTFLTNPGLCNLSCLMCKGFGSPNRHLSNVQVSFNLIERIISREVHRGLKEVIPSTMGEPLLYDHFESLLILLRKTGVRLNLTTNGTFPRGGVERWAPILLPVTSDIKISMQALDQQLNSEIMRGIDSAQQQQNVLALLQWRDQLESSSTISLQITAQKKNYSDIIALVNWAKENRIQRIKLNRVVCHENLGGIPLSLSDEEWIRLVEDVKKLEEPGSFIVKCQDPMGGKQGDCPFLGRELWIMEDGTIRCCCHPDYEFGAFPDLGNATLLDVVEVEESRVYQSLMREYREKEICQSCGFRLHLKT